MSFSNLSPLLYTPLPSLLYVTDLSVSYDTGFPSRSLTVVYKFYRVSAASSGTAKANPLILLALGYLAWSLLYCITMERQQSRADTERETLWECRKLSIAGALKTKRSGWPIWWKSQRPTATLNLLLSTRRNSRN